MLLEPVVVQQRRARMHHGPPHHTRKQETAGLHHGQIFSRNENATGVSRGEHRASPASWWLVLGTRAALPYIGHLTRRENSLHDWSEKIMNRLGFSEGRFWRISGGCLAGVCW